MKAYILYWFARAYISGWTITSGAVRVDSLEACEAGAKAMEEIHDELDPVHRSQLLYKCVPAK